VTLVLLLVTGFVVFAIAAVAVGRFTFASAQTARQAVFDLDEATGWVADALPYELQARLSHDDVRAVLGWFLDDLEDAGVAYERDEERRDDEASPPVVVDDHALTARVLGRAEEAGLDLSDLDVLLILEAGDGYLRAIGAVGTAAGPEEMGSRDTDRDEG
jgi:hypothetical protein